LRCIPRPQIEEWLHVSLPCPGGQGYGLTEACSASSMQLPDRPEMAGTVGLPLPCVEVGLLPEV
jgi:long-subunit acyl-CoA synthetase (AMP-forming)